ncbi:MAG TPA: SRPBCC family protein [Micromonosporaceae bacterium]|nr:SRPBCC family protein [Micromonosporaceae bacterium]
MAETQTTQVYRVFIRATAEQVWDAITKAEFTTGYFFGGRIETTLEPGSPIRYHSPSRDGLDIDGEVVESDPPHKLVHTFRSLWDDDLAAEPPSRVTWELEPADGGVCQLTVTHDQLERSPKTAGQVSGWSYILSGMKTLLETGKPMAA